MATNKTIIHHKFDLQDLPDKLYKYYKFDTQYNESRLRGDIYLASPLDFNDPCDCQLPPHNNLRDVSRDEKWRVLKMQELGYSKNAANMIATSLYNGDEHLEEVYKKQLENLGIFCVAQCFDNSLMWGYYADNDGFCIEYDTKEFVKSLIVGVVNTLSYELTKLLFTNKKYKIKPKERSKDTHEKYIEWAEGFQLADSVKKVTNSFLNEQKDDEAVANFLTNFLLKRIAGNDICYVEKDIIKEFSPTLFFVKRNEESENKYFIKSISWQHEAEFRIIVSLGGRKTVSLGKDIIKNVYLGCNTPLEKIMQIAHFLAINKVNCNLYMMKRQNNCELSFYSLDLGNIRHCFCHINEHFNRIQDGNK